VNERVGRLVLWLVLATVLVSAANGRDALRLRHGVQCLAGTPVVSVRGHFSAGRRYTLKHNGHVRIDIFYGRLSERARVWVDLLGALVFLLHSACCWCGSPGPALPMPAAAEMSPMRGLLRWPVRLMIPLASHCLACRASPKLSNASAFLRGQITLTLEQPSEKSLNHERAQLGVVNEL